MSKDTYSTVIVSRNEYVSAVTLLSLYGKNNEKPEKNRTYVQT